MLSLFLLGCGQKGPLYLPQQEAQSNQTKPKQNAQQNASQKAADTSDKSNQERH